MSCCRSLELFGAPFSFFMVQRWLRYLGNAEGADSPPQRGLYAARLLSLPFSEDTTPLVQMCRAGRKDLAALLRLQQDDIASGARALTDVASVPGEAQARVPHGARRWVSLAKLAALAQPEERGSVVRRRGDTDTTPHTSSTDRQQLLQRSSNWHSAMRWAAVVDSRAEAVLGSRLVWDPRDAVNAVNVLVDGLRPITTVPMPLPEDIGSLVDSLHRTRGVIDAAARWAAWTSLSASSGEREIPEDTWNPLVALATRWDAPFWRWMEDAARTGADESSRHAIFGATHLALWAQHSPHGMHTLATGVERGMGDLEQELEQRDEPTHGIPRWRKFAMLSLQASEMNG